MAALSHSGMIAKIVRRLGDREHTRLDIAGFRPAAVAVMLLDMGGKTGVTLTLRSAHLRDHSGQVSFPGGTCDHDDESAIATAVRECREEIGVEPGQFQIMGVMDDEPTTSGFIITPIVVQLHSRPRYKPNPGEVVEVFEAPLDIFSDRARAEDLGICRIGDAIYTKRVYHYQKYRIQGATARILEHLSDLAR